MQWTNSFSILHRFQYILTLLTLITGYQHGPCSR